MSDAIDLKWFAGVGQSALLFLSEKNIRDYFLDKDTCRVVNDTGRRRVRELFGDRLRMPAPSCAAISYGHIASLGAHVHFPDGGEPNVEPMFSGLEEAILWLKREERFDDCDLFRLYYDTYLYLKESFPEEPVIFTGYGHQGPITTAVLLRGQDFYMDLYDDPRQAGEFLELLTRSIIGFSHFKNRINGVPGVSPDSGYIGDDLSSLVSPWLWPQFVVPYFNMYYEGTTTGKRNIHVENLSPDHLPHLLQAGIDFYDPSVSSQLSPRIIREWIGIDFTWRLLSIHIPGMTVSDVEKWVLDAVDQGARHLHTYITNVYCMPQHQAKAVAFMDTCQRLQGGRS